MPDNNGENLASMLRGLIEQHEECLAGRSDGGLRKGCSMHSDLKELLHSWEFEGIPSVMGEG